MDDAVPDEKPVLIEPATIRVVLPLPPTVNAMIALAKKRTRKAASGGWMNRAIPIVYDNAKREYETLCMVALADQGVAKPRKPWQYWSLLAADFRVRTARDWTELAAGLKWPVDALVRLGYLADDSPRHMVRPDRWPTQTVDRRSNPCVVITLRTAAAWETDRKRWH